MQITSTRNPPRSARNQNGHGPKSGTLPSWKPFLDSYPPDQQIELEFETKAGVHKAISLLWTPDLYECPHYLMPSGVIVPVVAIPYFRDAGLKFSEHPLA